MVAAILILSFVSQAILSEEQRFPEFECVVIKKVSMDIINNEFGKIKVPSLGLQRKSSGEWIFRKQDQSSILKPSCCKRTDDQISSVYTYEILVSGHKFRVELRGKARADKVNSG